MRQMIAKTGGLSGGFSVTVLLGGGLGPVALGGMPIHSALAQAADDDDPVAATADDDALWKRLDITEDGWLDGKELDGGWKKSDADGDGEVTKAEFMAGRARERPMRAKVQPATAAINAARA